MKFNYQNSGDILYGVETYRFRYNGSSAADIKLLVLLNDDRYAFQVKIEDDIEIPVEFKKFTSADFDLKQKLDLELRSEWETKEEALQQAINWTSTILEKYSSISTAIQNNNI